MWNDLFSTCLPLLGYTSHYISELYKHTNEASILTSRASYVNESETNGITLSCVSVDWMVTS